VIEAEGTLKRLLGRASEELEIVSTTDLGTALGELSRVPAQALIVNDPQYEQLLAQHERLAGLPYGTPVIGCWCRDEKVAAEKLGVVRYLVKPVRRDVLLAALDELRQPLQTILLADDEPEAIQLFGRMLSSAGRGYHIIRATTGRRALGLLRRHHPDVLLIDLLMPDMDGYQVLHAKSLDPEIRDIPSIAISAQDPAHGPLTNGLAATKNGGIYTEELLHSILALSQVLAPPDRVAGATRLETPPG
jgi:CheY-like chemotaxis protein